MRLCVVGAGYVGLVTGACFAEAGNHVICVDQDAEKIARLRQGVLPIYEPGLAQLVERNVQAERIDFTTNLVEGIRRAAVIFLAVGTPPAEDGSSDLSYVDAAVAAIGRTLEDLQEYRVIVMKSTVPVGTHTRITEALRAITAAPFDYVANPEFLKEGGAVEDFLRPHRVVRAVHAEVQPDAVHGSCLGGNDQVRGQRHAGDPDFLYERDLVPL
jgi:UDPglucose 6-dehydrogenase